VTNGRWTMRDDVSEAQLDRVDARMRGIDDARTKLFDAFRAYQQRSET